MWSAIPEPCSDLRGPTGFVVMLPLRLCSATVTWLPPAHRRALSGSQRRRQAPRPQARVARDPGRRRSAAHHRLHPGAWHRQPAPRAIESTKVTAVRSTTRLAPSSTPAGVHRGTRDPCEGRPRLQASPRRGRVALLNSASNCGLSVTHRLALSPAKRADPRQFPSPQTPASNRCSPPPRIPAGGACGQRSILPGRTP